MPLGKMEFKGTKTRKTRCCMVHRVSCSDSTRMCSASKGSPAWRRVSRASHWRTLHIQSMPLGIGEFKGTKKERPGVVAAHTPGLSYAIDCPNPPATRRRKRPEVWKAWSGEVIHPSRLLKGYRHGVCAHRSKFADFCVGGVRQESWDGN